MDCKICIFFFLVPEMSALTNKGTYFHQEIFINSMYYPTSIENIGFNFIRVDSEHHRGHKF